MKLPRLSGWLFATMLLLIAIYLLAPQQLPVSLYKLSLISMAGVGGYWLDRSLFPYARPDVFLNWLNTDRAALIFAASMLRRAVVVGCAMLAICLGA